MADQHTTDGEFLFGDRLSERVRDVARGHEARCAVAFWSRDGVGELFGFNALALKARIVCDISIGATSPDALEELGAPSNPQLRHHIGLHAKLYLSDRGLVIGSANASRGALGKGKAPRRLLEAGTFHGAGSDAWRNARDWFNDVHGKAKRVDTQALEWARKVYRPPPPGGQISRAPRPGSLLDAVRVAPERFAGVGFVFTRRVSNKAEIADAKRSAKRLGGTVAKGMIDSWPSGGIFTGWSKTEVGTWPTLFFEFWQPAKSLTVYGRKVSIHDPDHGSIFSTSARSEMSKRFGRDWPAKAAIDKADAALSLLIRGGVDGRLFADADDLAKRIAELDILGSGDEDFAG
jgi:hypothetical protein